MRPGSRVRLLASTMCLGLAVVGTAVGSAQAITAPSEPSDVTTQSATAGTVGQLVVKVADSVDIDTLNRRFGFSTRSTLLASHGVYLVDVPLAKPAADAKQQTKNWNEQVKRLVSTLAKDPSIAYAEANTEADIAEGERFHYWPSGGARCTSSDSGNYRGQPAALRLGLAKVHDRARGAGRVIAVLDTGIDDRHPALAGRIAAGGYDYVDDDRTPSEGRVGLDADADGYADEGYGHGTFVSGIAALVAPDARILPLRVLDAEGRGNVFVVAEAIYDAVDAGADVINLSFGTADKLKSAVLQDAVRAAEKGGAVVVGSAGNDGSQDAHYPAAMAGVISVAAQAENATALATFSARGAWVDIAAPGEHVVSTLPCGYGSWSGTSMAAPFVSGMAALLLELRPGAKPSAVAKAIQDGSDKVRGLQVHGGSMNLSRALDRVR